MLTHESSYGACGRSGRRLPSARTAFVFGRQILTPHDRNHITALPLHTSLPDLRHLAYISIAYPSKMSQRKAKLRSVQEAAAEVGIGSATVWRYLQRGLLMRYRQRIGRKRTLVDVAE